MRNLGLLLSIFYFICASSHIDATNRSRKIMSPQSTGEKRKKTKSTTNHSQRPTNQNEDIIFVDEDDGTWETSSSSKVSYIGSPPTTLSNAEEEAENDDDDDNISLSQLTKVIKMTRRAQSRNRNRCKYFSPPAQRHRSMIALDEIVPHQDLIQDGPYTYDPNRTPAKSSLAKRTKGTFRPTKRVSFAPEAPLDADQGDGVVMNNNPKEIPSEDTQPSPENLQNKPLGQEAIQQEQNQTEQEIYLDSDNNHFLLHSSNTEIPADSASHETAQGNSNQPVLRVILALQIEGETLSLSSSVEESSLESPLSPGTPEGIGDNAQEHEADDNDSGESLKLYALVSLLIAITVSMVLLGLCYLFMKHRPIRMLL